MSQTGADYSWLRRTDRAVPVVVAHRGASGLAPENTLAAFRLAVELGTPAVECDVHLSADGQVVVIHDPTVDRTTNGSGAVETLSFDALRALDAGSWFGARFAGERIPTLAEALAACAGRSRLFVELKVGGGVPLIAGAVAAIAAAPSTEVAIISFDPQIVAGMAQRRPDLPLGFLVSARQVGRQGPAAVVGAARDLGAGFLSPQYSAATPELIAAARQAGLAVSVWTVDDPADMRRLAAAGVDAITTNRPDLALKELEAPSGV
jgi:glycerophosphoryl diester phosphodiesterase